MRDRARTGWFSDKPWDAECITARVHPGDLVVTATDGLFDTIERLFRTAGPALASMGLNGAQLVDWHAAARAGVETTTVQ